MTDEPWAWTFEELIEIIDLERLSRMPPPPPDEIPTDETGPEFVVSD